MKGISGEQVRLSGEPLSEEMERLSLTASSRTVPQFSVAAQDEETEEEQ